MKLQRKAKSLTLNEFTTMSAVCRILDILWPIKEHKSILTFIESTNKIINCNNYNIGNIRQISNTVELQRKAKSLTLNEFTAMSAVCRILDILWPIKEHKSILTFIESTNKIINCNNYNIGNIRQISNTVEPRYRELAYFELLLISK